MKIIIIILLVFSVSCSNKKDLNSYLFGSIYIDKSEIQRMNENKIKYSNVVKIDKIINFNNYLIDNYENFFEILKDNEFEITLHSIEENKYKEKYIMKIIYQMQSFFSYMKKEEYIYYDYKFYFGPLKDSFTVTLYYRSNFIN